MSEASFVETADPSEAFAAVADDTRVDILRALWELDDHVVTFSELREAVGIRDSGQFNYHLDKLTDRFVRKTDEGYRLTLAGERVHGAVLSGAYTMVGDLEPIDLDDPCPSCGGSRTLTYEHDRVLIECDGCDLSAGAGIPPGVFADRPDESIPDVADRYFRATVQEYDAGFCQSCEGRVEPSVRTVADIAEEEPRDEHRDFPLVEYTCQRCGSELTADLGIATVDHPAVAGFYYERGVDVREESFWDLVVWDTDGAWIESEEPFRAAVRHEVGGDAITVVVDDSLAVVAVDRHSDPERDESLE